jgi:hypothetical protein
MQNNQMDQFFELRSVILKSLWLKFTVNMNSFYME